MTLELDVFSGRPNPRWNLTAEETTHLHKLLRDLPQVPETRESGLGYRAFVLTEGQKRITVSKGLVQTDEQGRQFAYRDTTGVEAFLRQLATDRGHGDLMQALD
jgi:hypothetical protein